MAANEKKDEPRKRVSKTTMLLGAAGLFLFIVGVKRGMRVEGTPAERAPDTDGERSG
jgi:hypothetical protein